MEAQVLFVEVDDVVSDLVEFESPMLFWVEFVVDQIY